MPEVSRFYGIVVKIFYDHHHPPHFHAEYGEHEALVNITASAGIAAGLGQSEAASAARRIELCPESVRHARRVRFRLLEGRAR
jgi:hypothetical protein